MAAGVHWEWRGFGDASARLRARIEALTELFGTARIRDEYLWIPGIEVNAKLRAGVPGEEGLKLKRLVERRDDLERWTERPEEVFPFPLGAQAWRRLSEVLRPSGIELPPAPAKPAGREAVLAVLARAGVARVVVEKSRTAKLWDGRVKVEIAEIFAPQRVSSIGLETWPPEQDAERDEAEQVLSLRAAHAALDLAAERLMPRSYLDAVAVWARGRTLEF